MSVGEYVNVIGFFKCNTSKAKKDKLPKKKKNHLACTVDNLKFILLACFLHSQRLHLILFILHVL